MWWFFCILTTTMYRGSLIARLTVPTRSPTLDTLDKLAASNLEWGMLDTYGSGYQLFRASQVYIYIYIYVYIYVEEEAGTPYMYTTCL